jgi:hypothetical protein
MASAVTTFVAMEVFRVSVPTITWFFAGVRVLAMIAMVGVVMGVDVPMEVRGAVEPGACSDEDSAGEPLRAVVAVRGAVIGRSFIVAVRACGSYADAYADLGVGWGRSCDKETQTSENRESKGF